jgi:FKBP-type peptidyl-prolyl cis-trans isomerase SlyD
MGGILPEVERALDGRTTGDQLRVQLSEKQAYGARNPKQILEVDREDFPDDVAPGDRFEVENQQGGVLILHVLDVQSDFVVVDTNHPLSGQAVEFAVEVMEVRPASEDEIAGALLCLEDDQEEPGHGVLHPVPDVPPSALIRRRQQ